MKKHKLYTILMASIIMLIPTVNIYSAMDVDISTLLKLKSELKANNEKLSTKENNILASYQDTLAIIDSLLANNKGITEENKQIIMEKIEQLRVLKAEMDTYKAEFAGLQEAAKSAKENSDKEGAAKCMEQLLLWQKNWISSLDELNAIMEEIRNVV